MVFGSPKQRSSTGGLTALRRLATNVSGLAGIAEHAEDRDVTILVEALPHSQSDVIHTMDEAVAVVREINVRPSPPCSIHTMRKTKRSHTRS